MFQKRKNKQTRKTSVVQITADERHYLEEIQNTSWVSPSYLIQDPKNIYVKTVQHYYFTIKFGGINDIFSNIHGLLPAEYTRKSLVRILLQTILWMYLNGWHQIISSWWQFNIRQIHRLFEFLQLIIYATQSAVCNDLHCVSTPLLIPLYAWTSHMLRINSYPW